MEMRPFEMIQSPANVAICWQITPISKKTSDRNRDYLNEIKISRKLTFRMINFILSFYFIAS